MSRILNEDQIVDIKNLIDELDSDICTIEYLAEVEDKPGLSNILIDVSKSLELVKVELKKLPKD